MVEQNQLNESARLHKVASGFVVATGRFRISGGVIVDQNNRRGLGGFKRWGRELAGAQTFSKFKGSLDLGDLGRPEVRHLEQVLDVRTIEAAQSSKVGQQRSSQIGDVLPRRAKFECADTDSQDDRGQFGIRELARPILEQSFPQPLLFEPVLDSV
jgi:hypothetical protein